MVINERKCVSCNTWVNSDLEVCPNCNAIFYESEKIEHEVNKERAKREIDIPFIPILKSDPFPLKFLKRIVQLHQLVFYLILYFVAYMAAAFAG